MCGWEEDGRREDGKRGRKKRNRWEKKRRRSMGDQRGRREGIEEEDRI
jgi:hypothetical protein